MIKILSAKMNSWHCRSRNNIAISLMILLSAFVLSFAGSYNGTNPSLQKIDSDWRALYGSPVHQGIVVFNKMAGGNNANNDISYDTVYLMRLVSISNTATMKKLLYFKQWSNGGNWGVSSTYRISPDGAKIAMANNIAVEVCDTNGLNLKQIKPVNLNTDQLNMSWDDSAGIRRIVYSAGSVILRTVVNSDNSAGKTDTLWNHASGRDPSGASFTAYTSVNKVGNFLSFNIPDGVTGNNDPIVANLATKTAMSPSANSSGGIDDGCQVRMLEDHLGTVSYHQSTHLRAAYVWRWGMATGISHTLYQIPCPTNSGCADCGNNMFYWCDSDTNFMIQTGDNDAKSSPGCYTKAFIRKGKTSANVMYLGDYVSFPALWIDSNPFVSTETINKRNSQNHASPISIQILAHGLILRSPEGEGLDNVILCSMTGAIVAKGNWVSSSQQRVTITSLRAGMYLLSWHEGNSTMSKYVTLAR